jgi:prepilin-type N-terminal cleavage/methylation domain-containing protein/prepilin-type processing-associated H-X9-DG protein
MHLRKASGQRGFSLPEVLIVIGVLGMLFSLLMPAVQRTRGTAVRIDCSNRMRQIGIALHGFHDAQGSLPAGVRRPVLAVGRDLDPEPGASWLTRILPYIEQEPIAAATRQAFRQDPVPWNDPPHVALSTVVAVFICPSDGRLHNPVAGPDGRLGAYTSYVGVSGGFSAELNGVLGLRPGIRLNTVVDGTSSTLMVGERPPNATYSCGLWYTSIPSIDSYLDHDLTAEAALDPNNPACGGHAIPVNGGTVYKYVYSPGRVANPCDKYHFWSLHSDGGNFVFADASVRFVPYTSSPILRALATRNGGEIVQLP